MLRVFLHLDLYRTFWQCVVSERYQKLVLAPVDQCKVTKLDFSEADGLGKVQLEQICRLSLRGYLQVSYKS